MKIVELDTKIFKGKKPRDWHNVVKDYVYNNLAGKTITIYNEDGSVEKICFAGTNERVRKDNANNSHKVINKLALSNNNIRNLCILQIYDVLQLSFIIGFSNQHTHQWLDEYGWEYRKIFLRDKYNNVWEAVLNIAKTHNGRFILYDINKIKKVEQAIVSSFKGLSQRSTFSDKNIP